MNDTTDASSKKIPIEHSTVNYTSYEQFTPKKIGLPIYQFDEKQGKKFDDNKSEWNLLYYPCLESLVRVMMLGKGKYGFENWKKPFDKKRLINAGMRHMVAHLNGEYLDDESKEPHIIHVIANCMMLYFHEEKHEKE